MGDFNIAPNAEDVWNEEIMKNKVSFHPKEHEQLKEISETGLTDIFRKFDQRPGQFSWWDFRTRGFERGEGMRIDYILANSVLTSSCCTCIIDFQHENKIVLPTTLQSLENLIFDLLYFTHSGNHVSYKISENFFNQLPFLALVAGHAPVTGEFNL
ncbi:MAG: hypothetical protein CM1200mP28_04550 [Deltaproteobacteria bacterium]|nr:MAG: hypothetical protein CM1200mP28_04550 [Deltaproteobacteria bacterium]